MAKQQGFSLNDVISKALTQEMDRMEQFATQAEQEGQTGRIELIQKDVSDSANSTIEKRQFRFFAPSYAQVKNELADLSSMLQTMARVGAKYKLEITEEKEFSNGTVMLVCLAEGPRGDLKSIIQQLEMSANAFNLQNDPQEAREQAKKLRAQLP